MGLKCNNIEALRVTIKNGCEKKTKWTNKTFS